MNIGVYSGTFDPLHLGHIKLADRASQEVGLDKTVWLIEDNPRSKKPKANYQDRLGMLQTTLTDKRNIIDELEIQKQGNRHSNETMQELKNHFGEEHDYYLIMGADVFLNIDTWEGYQELIAEHQFVIGLRSEDDGEELIYKRQQLPNARVHVLSFDEGVISSTKIREDLLAGISTNIDQNTLKYIQKNKLYEYTKPKE